MVVFATVLAVISGYVIVTGRQVASARDQEKIAAGIAQGASDLGYLSNEYLIYRENQQLSRWESRYASLSAEIASLEGGTPGQRALVDNIRSGQVRIKEVFDSVVSAAGGESQVPVDLQNLQVAWSRMAVQSQGLISDASMLSELLGTEADDLSQLNTYVVFAMIGIFGVFFLINFFLIQRRTLKAIDRLHAGTEVIGSGNLDFVLEKTRNDEIGELSRAFNTMTDNLRQVTASKSDLEREVTERKRAEQELHLALTALERSNADLEQFAYVASHDLQEPLRMVASYVKLLERRYGDKLDADAREFMEYAVEGAERMRVMITDLLAYSRVGTQAAQPMLIDSGEALEAALENLKLAIEESGAIISHGDLPQVTGDLLQLTHLFQNLVGNAIKFCGEQPPRISIEAREQDGEWVFSVIDNGIGIDPGYADRIFDIFQRLHTRGEYPGTGIGLAICKKIVDRHGGRIWMESQPGEGCIFNFTIPAA
jgi:signal transduction histidine kinase